MKKIILFLLLPLQILAQTNSFSSFKAYNFPTELCAAASGSKIAWALDEQGKRNVYVAEGPAFTPRKLTNYLKDDGQEITSLSISGDGKWVVFVRGGDHGSNWDQALPLNPAFEPTPFNVQVGNKQFNETINDFFKTPYRIIEGIDRLN